MVKRADGIENKDFISNIEQLIAYHFPVDDGDNPLQSRIKHETHNFGADDPDFSQKEIDAIVRSANRGKVTWTDGVPMEVIALLYSCAGQISKCSTGY